MAVNGVLGTLRHVSYTECCTMLSYTFTTSMGFKVVSPSDSNRTNTLACCKVHFISSGHTALGYGSLE